GSSELFLGSADRRAEGARQRQLAVFIGQLDQRRRQTGQARGPGAVLCLVRVQVALGVEVHLRGRGFRRDLARVQEQVLAGGGIVQQEEAAAAEPGTDRF